MTSKEQRLKHLISRNWPNHELVKSWSLKGGTSAETTAFRLSNNQTYVLREHVGVKSKEQQTIVEKEYSLLEALTKKNIKVPKPILKDTSILIFEHPIVILEFVRGEPVFASEDDSVFEKMAWQLASIHAVRLDEAVLALLPDAPSYVDCVEPMHPLKGSLKSKLETYGQAENTTVSVIHGDFWPGNILWSHKDIAAVIDWEDAVLGHPLIDVSRVRLELFWFFGEEAMQVFTDSYFALTKLSAVDLAYFDALAALRHLGKLGGWGLEASEKVRMEAQLEQFAQQAMRRL